MAFLAVDKFGGEHIFDNRPTRGGIKGKTEWKCSEGYWVDEKIYDEIRCVTSSADDYHIRLPKGTIKKIIGRDLTWHDEPFEIK